jgi:hypothetical protein
LRTVRLQTDRAQALRFYYLWEWKVAVPEPELVPLLFGEQAFATAGLAQPSVAVGAGGLGDGAGAGVAGFSSEAVAAGMTPPTPHCST